MKTSQLDARILRLLASMPFLDRMDISALSNHSRGATYHAVARLERDDLVESIPHATDLISPTRRFALSNTGTHKLAYIDQSSTDQLLHAYPLSAHWQRILLQRLDAAAVIYRLAAATALAHGPMQFQWFRATPMDATITLNDQRSIAVVRRGPNSDTSPFAKRIWRLLDEHAPSAILIITPDDARMRHANRLLAQAHVPTFVAREEDISAADPFDPIWRTPSLPSTLDLHHALRRLQPARTPPREAPTRAIPPHRLPTTPTNDDAPYYMLPSTLKPAQKRALDFLSDWPWITSTNLARIMGVSPERLSQLLTQLQSLDLVTSLHHSTRARRLALTDKALALIARRDRTSIHTSLKRWSIRPIDTSAPTQWPNVSGSKSRQLLRNIHHTHAVHHFLATLAAHARHQARRLLHIDPPSRASRYFRHHGTLRSIHPDAFAILRTHHQTQPFFLEWERRATTPSTMTARIAPYIRYFSTPLPSEDHDTFPILLIVFQDPLAAARFLSVARSQIAHANVHIPLLVSHQHALQQHGPLGAAWRSPTNMQPIYAFH